MGTLTLDDIKDEIRSGLGGRTDLDSRLARVLNLSQMRIARAKKWEELETLTESAFVITATVADDRRFVLPAGTRDIHSFLILDSSTSRKLTFIPNRRWDKLHPMPEDDSRRRPEIYTRWGEQLEVHPVPDIAYNYRMRRTFWPVPFVDGSGSAVSDLDEKDDLLVALSLSWIFTTLRMMEDAKRWFAIYANQLEAAIGEDLEQPDADILPSPAARDRDVVREYWLDPFRFIAP